MSAARARGTTPTKVNNSAMASALAPVSWQELVGRVREVFSSGDVEIEEVKDLMAAYTSDPRDWECFTKFDPHRYAGGVSVCCDVLATCTCSPFCPGTPGTLSMRGTASITCLCCVGGRGREGEPVHSHHSSATSSSSSPTARSMTTLTHTAS